MASRQDTAEFMAKAKELGLIDEIDQKLEARKHERRLAIIAEIKALPAIEKTEIPALGKASIAAHKELELAEEAYRAAERNYKELSTRVYGAQMQFDGERITREREAMRLAPDFLRETFEDLGILEGYVQEQFRYDIESVNDRFFGRRTVTTSNGEAVKACRGSIKSAQGRITQMMLEATPLDEAQAEAVKIFTEVEAQAYALGVNKQMFADRRKPIDVTQKAEDYASKERMKAAAKRSNAIQSLSA